MKFRKIFNFLFKLMYKLNPDTLALSIPIDNITDIHYIVEKSYKDKHEFGTKTEYYIDEMDDNILGKPAKYIQKSPSSIQAVQWNGSKDNLDYIKSFAGDKLLYRNGDIIKLSTEKGNIKINMFDFIVKDKDDNLSLIDQDTFENLYYMTK